MIRKQTAQRGGKADNVTIDATAYNVVYIATIVCDTAQHSCDRMP